jgi:hypothetical protein
MSAPSRSEWIRVSCAALCRIEHVGRFLLMLNSNRREKGVYVLSPIGGALSLFDPLRLVEFGAIPEDPNSADLRLTMRRTLLPDFRDWFSRGEGRERSPFRELQEELVVESRLLRELEPEDVTCTYLWTVEQESFTDRQGQTGLLTHYFLEIHDIKFNTEAALGPLLVAPEESGVVWLPAEQIDQPGTIQLRIDGALREVHLHGQIVLHPPQPNGEKP